jgi:hypothetical protein
MSGEGTVAMNIRGSGSRARSLQTIAALHRVPLDETEDLLEMVDLGVISHADAKASIYAEGLRQQGVY